MIRKNRRAEPCKMTACLRALIFAGFALFSWESQAQYTDLSSAYDKLVQSIVITSGTNEVLKNQGVKELSDSVKKMINDSLTSDVLNETPTRHRSAFATYYYAVLCGDIEYAVLSNGTHDYVKKRIVMLMNNYPINDDNAYNETEEIAMAFGLGLSYAIEKEFTQKLLTEKIKALSTHKDFLYSIDRYIQNGGLEGEPKSKMEQSVLVMFIKMSRWASANAAGTGK